MGKRHGQRHHGARVPGRVGVGSVEPARRCLHFHIGSKGKIAEYQSSGGSRRVMTSDDAKNNDGRGCLPLPVVGTKHGAPVLRPGRRVAGGGDGRGEMVSGTSWSSFSHPRLPTFGSPSSSIRTTLYRPRRGTRPAGARVRVSPAWLCG
jgi:hypothetical protein